MVDDESIENIWLVYIIIIVPHVLLFFSPLSSRELLLFSPQP